MQAAEQRAAALGALPAAVSASDAAKTVSGYRGEKIAAGDLGRLREMSNALTKPLGVLELRALAPALPHLRKLWSLHIIARDTGAHTAAGANAAAVRSLQKVLYLRYNINRILWLSHPENCTEIISLVYHECYTISRWSEQRAHQAAGCTRAKSTCACAFPPAQAMVSAHYCARYWGQRRRGTFTAKVLYLRYHYLRYHKPRYCGSVTPKIELLMKW